MRRVSDLERDPAAVALFNQDVPAARGSLREHLRAWTTLQWGLFCVVGILGTTFSLLTTRHAVGLPTDAFAYLGAAHNILAGRGVTTPFTLLQSRYGPSQAARFGGAVPLTQFPPLFPLAVASVASFGISVTSAARFLNGALFGVNLVLVGLLTGKVTRARFAPLAVALLVLVGPVSFGIQFLPRRSWLVLYSQAMSEPLFITWSLLALLLLSRYLSTGRLQELLRASAFVGLAALTRYGGISLLIAALVVIMLWGPGSRAARSRASGLVLVVSLFPIGAWALYNSLVQHGTAPRSFRIHLKGFDDLVNVMEGWLIPSDWPVLIRHGVLLMAVLLVAAALFRLSTTPRSRDVAIGPFRLIFTFVCVYIAVLVFTQDFLDATMRFDDRLFAPIQPLFYILVISSIWLLLANRSKHQNQRVVDAYLGVQAPMMIRETFICVALCLAVALPALHSSIDTVVNGFPGGPPVPATLAAAEQLPRDVFIATNVGAPLWFETGRASIGVPAFRVQVLGTNNERFLAQLSELVAIVRSRRGVIVVQRPTLLTVNLASQRSFMSFRSLHVLANFNDGVFIGPREIVAQLASQPPHIRLRVVPRAKRPLTARQPGER